MGKLIIRDHTGHSTVEFDKANRLSIEEAERRIAEVPGCILAEPIGRGEFKKVEAFNPDAEEVHVIRPLIGG